jgi:hypothetical protein
VYHIDQLAAKLDPDHIAVFSERRSVAEITAITKRRALANSDIGR